MTDEEIATKLAQAMGGPVTVQHFEDGRVQVTTCIEHNDFQMINWFDPSTRWDHCGIVIDWMESRDPERYGMRIVSGERGVRWVQFGVNVVAEPNSLRPVRVEGKLTPRHICLAAIEALE